MQFQFLKVTISEEPCFVNLAHVIKYVTATDSRAGFLILSDGTQLNLDDDSEAVAKQEIGKFS